MGQNCPDSIGTTGDFRAKGRHFAIPYSTLYNENFPNLFAAGRIISAHGEGWEITRVIPVCALTGEAAGTAAAMTIVEANGANCNADDLPIEKLQDRLIKNGVVFNNEFFI